MGTISEKQSLTISSAQKTTKAQTDEELLRMHLAGNEQGLALLMKKYKDPLVTYVYRFLGNYDDAVDVAQETFLRVHRFGHTFVGDVRFMAWLYAIARNLARTELQRHRRKNRVSMEDAFGVGDDASWDIPDMNYQTDTQTDSTYITQQVQSALMKISPTYREMVVLRDIQQLSYEEISSITETEMGTVKSRINRGRTQLQTLLKDLYGEIFSHETD